MLSHILRPIARNARTGARSYHVPETVKPPTMDELPVPCGPWEEYYKKQQAKNNMQLAAGIIALIGAIVIGRLNNTLWLNFTPPTQKKPEGSE